MLSGVCIGTNDIAAAQAFYDEVLATIGMQCVFSEAYVKGYAGADRKISIYLVVPFNEQSATVGNGTQVIFSASDANAVNEFHAAAIRSGGSNEGLPGPRDYHPDYYGAYVRDLDGNKLHVAVNLDG